MAKDKDDVKAFRKANQKLKEKAKLDGVGNVVIHPLDLEGIIEYGELQEAQKAIPHMQAFLFQMSVFKKGVRLFAASDRELLAKEINTIVMVQVSGRVLIMSGLLEDFEKNSESNPD